MKNQFFYSLIAAVFLLIFHSCGKFDDNYNYSEISAVSAVNAVPGSKGLDIGLDQNLLNSGWNEIFAYHHLLNYRNAYPGKRIVRVFDRSGSHADSARVKQEVTFVSGHYYSLYVIGNDKMELFVTQDDFGNVANGTAKFRFLNLAADAPKLSLALSDQDSLAFKDKSYKDDAAFKTIKMGELYQLKITGENMQALTGEFKPDNRAVYTIYSSGLNTSTDPDKKYNFQIVKHR